MTEEKDSKWGKKSSDATPMDRKISGIFGGFREMVRQLKESQKDQQSTKEYVKDSLKENGKKLKTFLEDYIDKALKDAEDNFGDFTNDPNNPNNRANNRANKKIVMMLTNLTKTATWIADDVKTTLDIAKQILESIDKNANIKPDSGINPKQFKPETISHNGAEYLYYPGAPKNRQFYEKSEKGTAGRIAPKKIQKKLIKAIKPKTAEKKEAAPDFAEAAKTIIENIQKEHIATIEKVISEHAPERKKEVSDLLKKIVRPDNKSNEVDNKEETDMLKEALKQALEEIIKEHPNLLKCSGGGGGVGDSIMGELAARGAMRGMRGLARGAGRLMRGARGAIGRAGRAIGRVGTTIADKTRGLLGRSPTSTPRIGTTAAESTATAVKKPGVLSKIGNFFSKGGAKTGAKIAGKTAFKSVLKKIPIIGAIAGLGFAASRLMKGDKTGAALEAVSGLAGTVPGVGTAASVGADVALAAHDMNAETPPTPETPTATATPKTESSGTINRNQTTTTNNAQTTTTNNSQTTTLKPTSQTSNVTRGVSTVPSATLSNMQTVPGAITGAHLMEINRTRAVQPQQNQQVVTPPPIINNVQNTAITPPADKIHIFNTENTFNRLQMQDVEHPSAYSNFNMG